MRPPQFMKYRATLVDASDATLQIKAQQSITRSLQDAERWATVTLKGRKSGVVEIRECNETLIAIIEANA